MYIVCYISFYRKVVIDINQKDAMNMCSIKRAYPTSPQPARITLYPFDDIHYIQRNRDRGKRPFLDIV